MPCGCCQCCRCLPGLSMYNADRLKALFYTVSRFSYLFLLDEAVKELKEALINAQESLGMSIAELERAIEQISRLGAECLMAQVIERSLEYELKKISLEDYEICSEPAERNPYPPYRERLHPRKHWQRKPYWLRTRSNPKKKGYH